jgi:hypothetical protein
MSDFTLLVGKAEFKVAAETLRLNSSFLIADSITAPYTVQAPVSPATFAEFLRALKEGSKLSLTPGNCSEMSLLCREFKVPRLQQACDHFVPPVFGAPSTDPAAELAALKSEVAELKRAQEQMKPYLDLLAYDRPLLLHLSTESGESFSIAAHRTDLVSTIKERIHGMAAAGDIPPSEQALIVRDDLELEDDKTLQAYGDATVDGSISISLRRETLRCLVRLHRPGEDSLTDMKVDLDWTGARLNEHIKAQSGGIATGGIMFHGLDLRDDQTLREAGIRQGSRLRLGASESMQIFLETPGGKHLTLQVDPDMFVEEVKELITMKTKDIAPAMQRLVFGGRQLEEGITLRDYSIKKDATLHLVLRARG